MSSGYSQVLKAETSAETIYYVRGFELISRRTGSGASYYLFDGGMSVRGITDEEGSLTDTLVFDAFGNEAERTGTTENSYGFQGEECDSTGLYYLRARYMDPSTGTFTSMDTYGGSLSDPMSLHKYLFANSNPVKWCDPSGHYTLSEELEVFRILSVLSSVSYSFLWAVDCEITDPNCEIHSLNDYLVGLLVAACFGMLYGMYMFTPAVGVILGSAMIIYSIPGFYKAFKDIKKGYVAYGIFEGLLSLITIVSGINTFGGGYESVVSGTSTLSVNGIWENSHGNIVYPPHCGAVPGSEIDVTLQPGDTVGRFGEPKSTSTFVTLPDTMANQLALPPNNNPGTRYTYYVAREITGVTRSTIADWAGSSGGGIQYDLPMPINYYVRNGYLVQIG